VTTNSLGLTGAKAALLEKYRRGELRQVAATRHDIPLRPPGEPIPLSFGQQQVWLQAQMAPNRPVYNECVTVHMTGPLNVTALERSLNEVIRRHEAWRTTFPTVNGEPVQIIHPPPSLSLPVVHLEGLPEAEREAEALRLATDDARLPFDLAQGPLLRTRLITLNDTTHRLYLALHHIIFDGVSIYDVFLPELAALYEAFSADTPSPLPEFTIQYADYAYWQRQRLQQTFLTEHMAYWREVLHDLPMLQLPTDHPQPTVQTFRGALQRLALPKTLTDALKELSRREGVTLYMTLMAAFITLLHHYAGQDDIVVGTVTGSRDRRETEKLMGFFVNTLALRADLSGNPTFRDLLLRVRRATLDMQVHRDVPFELVVRELQPQRNLTQNPLFQVMFSLEPPLAPFDSPWSISQLDIEIGTAKFALSVELDARAEGIIGRFEYSTDLFEPATIARMVGHYQTLLESIVADPGRRLAELPLLTEAERHQVLIEWNATETAYPRDQCIHHLFEARVERTPDAVAVVFENERLTYGELNVRANRLAHHLRALGVGPETLVAICMERSPEMIIGLLGILKAGGAYVPLDPKYPKERLAFMLADTRVPVLVTQARLVSKLPEHGATVVCLDTDRAEIARKSGANPASTVTASNVAYVIYTSGSTGTPKGVMTPHRGVSRLLFGVDYARLNASQKILQLAPLSFDASTFELWGALLHGGCCVLFPGDMPTSEVIGNMIRTHGITTLWLTASLFNTIIDNAPEALSGLEQLLVGGEALSVSHIRRTLQFLPGTQLINGYGPTESTTFACCYPVPRLLDERIQSIPIGRPIANTRAYIVDRQLQPVPVGIPGELYLGGMGLARGYLNRPDLTAERFIPDPFSSDPGARLYRTGDLARYLSDGNIEYLGRIDHQVKVRGFRIEPGEIEAALLCLPTVREVVVTVREDGLGNKRLVAYLVPHPELAPSVGGLHRYLQGKLPEYMIPSTFVLLDAMPLTANGKIDQHLLLAPDAARIAREKPFVPPQTLVQLQLARVWEEILDVRPVSITDDFFEMGGHSLLAARLVDRVTHLCGKVLPLASLFSGATIEHLAEILTAPKSDSPQSSIVRVQEGNAKRPFFFLHGDLMGGGLYCLQLARSLDPNRTAYAVQPFGPDGRPIPHTIEAMADAHLEALQTLQPEGPYHLGGFCLGGLIAFEMAQRLQARGQRVDSLIIIEPATAHARTRAASRFIERLGNLIGLHPEKQVRLFMRLREYEALLFRLLALAPAEMATKVRGTAGESLKKIYRVFRPTARSVAPRASLPTDDTAIAPTGIAADEIEGRYAWANAKYAPRPYRGRVAFFWARDAWAKRAGDPTREWKTLVNDLDAHATPGTHLSAITTHAEALAEMMRACLDTTAGEADEPE